MNWYKFRKIFAEISYNFFER